MRSRPRLSAVQWAVVAAAVLTLGAGALRGLLPYLTEKRAPLAGTPAPAIPGYDHPVSIAAGQAACMSTVTFVSDGERVLMHPITGGPPGPQLQLSAQAPGYSATTQLAAGYHDGDVAIPITPPRRATIGTFCVRNAGPAGVALAGSAPRWSRPALTVAGVPVDASITLGFGRARAQSYLGSTARLISHASAFRPWFQGPAALWLLLVLVVAGLPAGLLAALLTALREE